MTKTRNRLPIAPRLILFTFGFSGAAALIYEVAWIRSLSLVLGSTTYAVSTMLSAFMAGLALGSYTGGRLGDRFRNSVLLFGLCELGIGAFGILTIPAVNSLPPIYFLVYNKYHLQPDVYFIMQFIICFAIMLAPTMFMGATFPIVTKIVAGSINCVSSDVGKVYSINTVGAILGSFSAGFILIPLLGIKATAQAAACLNLLVALVALVASGSGRTAFIGGCGIVLFAALNLLVKNSEANDIPYSYYVAGRYDSYKQFADHSSYQKMIFRAEDPHGTVKVIFNRMDNSLLLQNGGKIESATGGDMFTTLMLAYLPLAAKPDAENFLGIGLGTGMTLRAAKGKMDDVDWVEINPSVVLAVKKFFYPGLMSSGVNIIIDDARNYLFVTEKKYDIISSEPSYPTEAAVANLFTYEFFRLAREKMNEGGVFCQWFPYYLFSRKDVAVMLKTFDSVFPHSQLWRVGSDLFLIGSKKRIEAKPRKIAERIREMNEFPMEMKFSLSRSHEQIKKIVKEASPLPMNTDDRPLLEFAASKTLITGKKPE